MKLTLQKLKASLKKSLAPIYFILGDELLLIQDTLKEIRESAEKAGFSERITITILPQEDWIKKFYEASFSVSLFANKKIVELNFLHTKISPAYGKVLKEYAVKPAPDTIVILYSMRSDFKFEKSSWYQEIDKQGIIIPIWPITAEQLPEWISQRAKQFHLTLNKSQAEALSAQVEGNLLAAAQEIEKLSLLDTRGNVTQSIENIVTDNARFDVFNLVNNALIGDEKKCIRILNNLLATQTEPVFIIWAITRELRLLANIQFQLKKDTPLHALFSQLSIWEKKQPLLRAALKRLSLQDIWACIIQAAKIDRMIKGCEVGEIADELQKLILAFSRGSNLKMV